jgi:hypothetical protein
MIWQNYQPYKPAGSRGAAGRGSTRCSHSPRTPCASRLTQGPPPHARVFRGYRNSAAHPRRPWSPATWAPGSFRVPPQAAAATPVVDTMATHLTRPTGRRKLVRVTCERVYASYQHSLLCVPAYRASFQPLPRPPLMLAMGIVSRSFGGETNCADER